MPEFEVTIENGMITSLNVLRGASCGATWEAARRVTGSTVEDAISRIGLETQFFCSANPANWDPVYGKSALHYAGELHSRAMEMAIKNCRNKR